MIFLDGSPLTLETMAAVAIDRAPVELTDSARHKMTASRQVINDILKKDIAVYGVNTGFGKLSDVRIAAADLQRLQLNLVRSHACGVGDPLSIEETRAMMLLRANVLAAGFSGARPVLAERLVQMLNAGIHPVIPSRGSVGASGDLAPLAHLALVVIGEGLAEFQGERMNGFDALSAVGLKPIELEAKEGLALLNGTQAIGAVGGLALARAFRLLDRANEAAAMSLEALRDTPAAYDPRIHAARPHQGQIDVAADLLRLMEGSEIRLSHLDDDPRVQDAYSIRCVPQVHGAVLGALRHVRDILEIETGSGTDNPLVFAAEGDVISGGNFHGAPLAYAFDYAAIVMTDLGGISERRIERLVNPDLSEGLPAFLTSHAGTGSGFMMAQVTAVALLNECKVLAHPASTDNMPTSGGKEDHVSMGMTSALKFRTIVENVARVLAIEFMAAAEGLEYRKPLKPGVGVLARYNWVRERMPAVVEDRVLGIQIEALSQEL